MRTLNSETTDSFMSVRRQANLVKRNARQQEKKIVNILIVILSQQRSSAGSRFKKPKENSIKQIHFIYTQNSDWRWHIHICQVQNRQLQKETHRKNV